LSLLARRLISVVVLLAIYIALGFAVSGRPVGNLDQGEMLFAGHSIAVAAFFTEAGTFPVYVGLCILTLVLGTWRRGWFGSALVIIGALLGAWATSDLFKEFFRRSRPEQWYALHETSFSYASGHATLSLVFYGTWMYLLWRTVPSTPWRNALLTFIGLWVLAIGWSRLALGAHWPTDLLGGYLLGAAWLMLSMTAVDVLLARRRAST
jgi:undecaprenyl-diphosphatase